MYQTKEKHCHITEPSTMRTWNLNGPFAVRGKAISFTHNMLLKHSAYVIFSLLLKVKILPRIVFKTKACCAFHLISIDKQKV